MSTLVFYFLIIVFFSLGEITKTALDIKSGCYQTKQSKENRKRNIKKNPKSKSFLYNKVENKFYQVFEKFKPKKSLKMKKFSFYNRTT